MVKGVHLLDHRRYVRKSTFTLAVTRLQEHGDSAFSQTIDKMSPDYLGHQGLRKVVV